MWLRQQISRVLGLRASDTKRSSKNYADRVLKKLASGAVHSTLGNNIRDEAYTRAKAAQWLKVLQDCGLKHDMLCVEYGCGSLWAAEPVIEFLEPGKFIGVDIVDGFYKMGEERIRTGEPEAAAIRRHQCREPAPHRGAAAEVHLLPQGAVPHLADRSRRVLRAAVFAGQPRHYRRYRQHHA